MGNTPQSLSATIRNKNILTLQYEDFDLLIVGGGITGAGVARDAASRGMKVALIEADDFASGTSSRSSKLIHGGIRYLEQYEFDLVFEALSERQRLFDMAPHLVHPLRFVIPLYQGGRVKPVMMKLGMVAYDVLSLFDAPEMHAHFSSSELSEAYPVIRSEKLMGGFTYYDAYMDDDRLVLETLRSAAEHGTVAANYVKAGKPIFQNGVITGLECRDQRSGKSFSIRAKHVVASVGPWTDQFGHQALSDWKSILRPSKGVHLTFPKGRLPLTDAVVMAAEKRIVFAIPRHEMIIIGTTETDFTGDPAEVTSTKEDVDYLLKVAQTYFPSANLTKSDIISSYAGVRPLVRDDADSEGKTSREHIILHDSRNITFIAGGKYTTYRHMAEQAVEQILQTWSLEDRIRFGESQTLVPLNPLCSKDLFDRARLEAKHWSKNFNAPNWICKKLADRHGMEAEVLMDRYWSKTSGLPSEELRLWAVELFHSMDSTMCVSLRDFYFRRVPLFLAREDHGMSYVGVFSQILSRYLGLAEDQRQQDINALQKQIQHELSWRIDSTVSDA